MLTRLPPPHRAPAVMVWRFLRNRFPEPFLCLPDVRHQDMIATLVDGQIHGGQVYDALIGLTAAEHGATLASFDRRAALIYEAVGVNVERPD